MKITYSKKSVSKMSKVDFEYIELLHCLTVMQKYGIRTYNGLFSKLLGMTSKLVKDERV